MRVTVLMPTYNDEKYISEAIQSILSQSYKDIELIITNDGSSDNTEEKVRSFHDDRIIYLKQENMGQLNAIYNSIKYITGDLVMLVHSDDMLYDSDTINKNVTYFRDKTIEGIYCDLIQVDEANTKSTIIKMPEELNNKAPVQLLFRLGSNLIPDPFFCTIGFFKTNVVNNYLMWNIPYWIKVGDQGIGVANIKKSIYPWYKYRVYHQNYIKSDIGKFVATNGCLRSVLTLSRFFSIPLYRIQKRTYSMFKNIIFSNSATRYRANLVKNTINRYYGFMPSNKYYRYLINFYSIRSNRNIDINSSIKAEDLIYGKDIINFYNKIANNNLSSIYNQILEEANKGFRSICVPDAETKDNMEVILKLLNIYAEVTIRK